MQKSIRFFIRILPVFLARVKPASHMANPACIKKTRAAPRSTQMVLTAENVIQITPFPYISPSVPPCTKKEAPGMLHAPLRLIGMQEL